MRIFRATALGFAGLVFCAGSAAAAPPRDAPFEHSQNLVFLETWIGHAGPFSFILDSGASLTVIDDDHSALFPRRGRRRGRAAALGGAVDYELVPRSALQAAGAHLGARAALIDLARLEPKLARRIDGILGSEIFQTHIVEIDYRARRVRLHDPATFAYSGPGEEIPIEIEIGTPFVRASFSPDGVEWVEGVFLVDTGAISALYLNPHMVARRRLGERMATAPDLFAAQLGGEIRSRVGRMPALRLGRYSFAQVPAHLLIDTGTDGNGATTRDGLIGAELLRRFRVFFDYRGRRMILEPNGAVDTPFLHDLSGMELIAVPPGFSRLAVRNVDPDGAAARAGVRAGDLVAAIEGAAPGSLDAVEERLGRAGPVSMRLIRNGEAVDLVLELSAPPA